LAIRSEDSKRVWSRIQPKEGKQIFEMSQSITDPAPTDLEIAQSTVPVGINLITQTQSNHGRACANQVECRCSQNQAQASQGIGISNFTGLQWKTSRFIIQKIFFNGLITNDKFCMTRSRRLQLNWSRRPLRLRIPVTEEKVYSASEESECGGNHETPVENSPEGTGVPRRTEPVGSSLFVSSGNSSFRQNGSDANRPGGAACE